MEESIVSPSIGLISWSLMLGIPLILGLLGLYWVVNKKDQDE